MSNEPEAERDADQPMIYQIRIKGHLSPEWADWFEGLTITLEEDDDTLLTGPVVDQAALHGLLKKVRDLGMPLLSVNSVGPDSQDMSAVSQTCLKDSSAQLLSRWALVSIHAGRNLYAFEYCICSTEERRMHGRMDCPLHDRHHICNHFRCISRQYLASTSDSDSCHHLRGCHSFDAILHHATFIWTWICCIKNVKSCAGKTS